MGINFKGVIKGTIFAILVTFVIILILALLSYFTGIDETIITTGAYASVIIGVILGTIGYQKRQTAEHLFTQCLYVRCI